jgi:regulatory protein
MDGFAAEFEVTAVERDPKRPGQYVVHIGGCEPISVHEDVLVKHRLMKGTRVDPEALRGVMEDEERHKAWSDALKYIGRRARSEREMRLYLRRKGYSELWIDSIVGKLRDQRYLNDADFAAQWTEQRMLTQKKGRRLVKLELKQKGVADQTVLDALRRVPEQEEERMAFDLGLKKWNQVSGTALDKKRKTAAYLLRRGYSSSIAGKVIRRLAAEVPTGESERIESNFDPFDE